LARTSPFETRSRWGPTSTSGTPSSKPTAPPAAPPIGIGNGSRIEGAILDKNCRIGQNVQIVNERKVETRGEDEACIIRDGIPIVVKEGVLPDGWKL